MLLLAGGNTAGDCIVGEAEVQQEMSEAIEGSKLHIYPELGHGAFAEAKDFNDHLYSFFIAEKQE